MLFDGLEIASLGLVASTPLAHHFYMSPPAELSDLLWAKRNALLEGETEEVAKRLQNIDQILALADFFARQNAPQEARAIILQLEKYGPLLDFPSRTAHQVLSWTGMTQNLPEYGAHGNRMSVMEDLLQKRLGDGTSPDSPLRLILTSELREWAAGLLTSSSRLFEIKNFDHGGKSLFSAQYERINPGGAKAPVRTIYFEFHPKIHGLRFGNNWQQEIPSPRLFLTREVAFWAAKKKRDHFLADNSYSYVNLRSELGATLKEAETLARQEKLKEAWACLTRIEKIRPLLEIPTPGLLGLCAHIHKGNPQNLFAPPYIGVIEALVRSGDGLSFQTAVHVILIEEEYYWLSVKNLTRTKQRFEKLPEGSFDILTARDSEGKERDYYFNVTLPYARAAAEIAKEIDEAKPHL